jgi:hypothetical protein
MREGGRSIFNILVVKEQEIVIVLKREWWNY